MKYTPPLRGKNVTALVVILLVIAAVFFVMPGTTGTFGVIPPAVFQVAGVASAVAGIFIAVRYVFTHFTYTVALRGSGADDESIEAWEGETDVTKIPPSLLDLTVVKSQGNRPGAAECILSLDDLKKVVRFTGKKKLSEIVKKEYGCDALYDYTVNMYPPMVTVLIFAEGERTIAVALECDENMTSVLSAVSSSGKYGKRG